MSKIDDGGPAFPRTVQRWNDSFENVAGMSLRDWFAGQAIAGMLAKDPRIAPSYFAVIADQAYKLADAMLTTRKETK